jgi:uncharacterized membrane protein (Fun14 family)
MYFLYFLNTGFQIGYFLKLFFIIIKEIFGVFFLEICITYQNDFINMINNDFN